MKTLWWFPVIPLWVLWFLTGPWFSDRKTDYCPNNYWYAYQCVAWAIVCWFFIPPLPVV